jgi:putative endopeptidase
MRNYFWAILLCILGFYACKQKTVIKSKPDFLVINIDTTLKVGDDFFAWAEGNWLKNNPIPANESEWGIGNLVNEELYLRKLNINENAVNENAPEGSISRKIADFWQSGMDSVSLEKEGLNPLQADFAKIEEAKTVSDLVKLSSLLFAKGANIFWKIEIKQDYKNSEVVILELSQGGLGLPETDKETKKVQNAYQNYIISTFLQLGNDTISATKICKSIYEFEKSIGKSSKALEAMRDPYTNYHKMSVAQWSKQTPNIAWKDFFSLQGIAHLDSVIVGQPAFFTNLDHELIITPIETLKNYLKFHLIRSFARQLDSKTFKNYFEYTQATQGATLPKPRWKRVLDTQERMMGEALGQLFAKEFFNEKAKKRYTDLVENIRIAMKDRINNLTWMSEITKQKSYEKLEKLQFKIGYPDEWKDFSQMNIQKQAYILNFQNAKLWWTKYQNSKLGKPVNRKEWIMSPQTYDAYYEPSNNEMVLPAGIFAVPGLKDEELDDAFVYGYAGASTIGHELTHGFDDVGRQYDAQGNLKNWWQKEDEVQFNKRAQDIIQQFNAFIPVDALHVNGTASQGENIADLGGLLLGLDAFKKTPTYKNCKLINGFTPLQRYFLGYAYGWMYHSRKEELATLLKTDFHAPPKERVNGPIVNIPEFYEAFNIKPTDKMYRPDSLRVYIW